MSLASLIFFSIGVWLLLSIWIESMVLTGLGLSLLTIAIYDVLQKRHTILRNFPILGHFRYLFEMIRPEISQYFIESDTNGTPISRELRSIVYQRSKNEQDTLPFGTKRNVYQEGYEWVSHSIFPSHVDPDTLRCTVGEARCQLPYSASRFNISAMSFGALSAPAIRALNIGAQKGKFAHNTGEGSISDHHLHGGGDLIWQIGTGYFGCRNPDGTFSDEKFKHNSHMPSVRMIEVKLSQGAKPGHGGILPASKITDEIARIRGVEKGKDVLSPPGHTAFTNVDQMLDFISTLRDLSGGKPVGIKLCLGNVSEFIDLIFEMARSQRYPDFITIDGGEGGTGAAPPEFSNSIGFPLWDALVITSRLLEGWGIKKELKLMVSGKLLTGFDLVKAFCLGADIANSGRGMMLALGCIQALRCNSNDCPTGVATQAPSLARGLHVPSKADRVHAFHAETLKSCAEIMGAMGAHHPDDLIPEMFFRRASDKQVETFTQRYPSVSAGSIVDKKDALDYVQGLFGPLQSIRET